MIRASRFSVPNRALGHFSITGPEGYYECETYTCSHCPKLVRVPFQASQDEVGNRCWNCNAMMCPACCRRGGCEPFEKKIDAMERRDRLLRAAGII